MTFEKLYEVWKADKASGFKASTYAAYIMTAETYLLPNIGEMEEIGEAEIMSLQEKLREGSGEESAYNSARLALTIIRHGAKKGLCPMPNWSVTRANASMRKRPADFCPLTPKQQAAIIAYIATDRSPRNIGVYLAVTTGVTSGELCSLRWQDIDFKARVLHVRGIAGNYYKINDETQERTWSVEVGENAAVRDIPLSDTQLRFLEPGIDAHSPEIFIINNQSKPWERRYLRDYIKKVYDELDIKGHQYKDLRHSFAIRCIEAGCDYGSLSRLLGVTHIDRLFAAYQPYVKEDPRKYMEKAMGAISSSSR